MSDFINIPVSVGELVDKITILEIKNEKIDNPEKLKYIRQELVLLQEVLGNSGNNVPENLYKELKTINEKLWDAEDIIRDCEQRQDFSESFVKCARLDAILNDKRFLAKDKINKFCNSNVREQKSYNEKILNTVLEE